MSRLWEVSKSRNFKRWPPPRLEPVRSTLRGGSPTNLDSFVPTVAVNKLSYDHLSIAPPITNTLYSTSTSPQSHLSPSNHSLCHSRSPSSFPQTLPPFHLLHLPNSSSLHPHTPQQPSPPFTRPLRAKTHRHQSSPQYHVLRFRCPTHLAS